MMFELDSNGALFVALSWALKKRSGGGREAPKRHPPYRQNIYPMKLKFIFSLIEDLG